MVDSEVNLTAAAAASEDASGSGPADAEELPDSVLVRLHEQLPEFTGALRRVADQVLADPAAAARAVDIYGASSSALVGAELQFCLHRIGVAAWSWKDIHDGLASAATLGTRDVAIGVSHSGQSRETIEVLAEAGSHGATTVALTSFARSPLAELADVVLLTAVQTTPFRPDALSARHPQLVVLDLLYIAVAQRLHDKAHTAFQVTARAVDAHRAAKDGAGG
jgi:DNA-binding MurR/RpiR family transcriptional regulator